MRKVPKPRTSADITHLPLRVLAMLLLIAPTDVRVALTTPPVRVNGQHWQELALDCATSPLTHHNQSERNAGTIAQGMK